jgi:hypothetical protein
VGLASTRFPTPSGLAVLIAPTPLMDFSAAAKSATKALAKFCASIR